MTDPVMFKHCRCCGGSSSSTSGSSVSCICCFSPDLGCCGCCCVHLPPNPPLWTRDIYLDFTGSGPCFRGETGELPLTCHWGGFSNVWDLTEFGFTRRQIDFNGGFPNRLLMGTVAYQGPDGYDWTQFCKNAIPVTMTQIAGGPGALPTFDVDPVRQTFLPPVPGAAAPCECPHFCGSVQFCSGFCAYEAHDNGDGTFRWAIATTNCGTTNSGAESCACDQDAIDATPAPTGPSQEIGYSCLPN